MVGYQIEKKRSYISCFCLSPDDIASLAKCGEELGFAVINSNNLEELNEALDLIQHCLGIFVQESGDGMINNQLIEISVKNTFPIRFFTKSETIPESMRAPKNLRPHQYITAFLDEIVPDKFRELCLFAVDKVTSNLIPDYTTKWKLTDQSAPKASADFLIFCEAAFDNFICAVTVRSELRHVESKSETLHSMDEQDIIEYFNEVSNQVLGVININLRKININSRIGLPVVVRGDNITDFKRRSSYFLPSLNISDDDGSLNISFQFLFPFLKNTPFLRDLDFQVGSATPGEALLIL